MVGYNVKFAVYGAMDGENTPRVSDVTSSLNDLLKASPQGLLIINNELFGLDPAKGLVKSFGAIVTNYAGEDTAYACKEGDSIDFS